MGLSSVHHPELVFQNFYKLAILVMEILMSEDYKLKDIFLIDLKYFHLSDITKLNFPVVKKLEMCAIVS